MAVTPQELLQPDMGAQLPVTVRQSLVEMGAACNQAVVLMNQVFGFTVHVQALLQEQCVTGQQGLLTSQVAADLRGLSEQHFEQAIVVLARAGTVYAVYASQVAAAVANNTDPPLPGSETISPSDVITACSFYLPEVKFSDRSGDAAAVREQNEAIADARKRLVDLITYRMHGDPVLAYDKIDAVAVTDPGSDDSGRLVEFAEALRVYASVLVWAVGTFGGAKPERPDEFRAA